MGLNMTSKEYNKLWARFDNGKEGKISYSRVRIFYVSGDGRWRGFDFFNPFLSFPFFFSFLLHGNFSNLPFIFIYLFNTFNIHIYSSITKLVH